MKFWSYLCPECDTFNKRAEGRVRDGVVVVSCPTCGFTERFPRYHLDDENSEVSVRV